jgi:hypothetical protein
MSNACKPLAIYIPANANKHFGSVGDKVTIKALIIDQELMKMIMVMAMITLEKLNM